MGVARSSPPQGLSITLHSPPHETQGYDQQPFINPMLIILRLSMREFNPQDQIKPTDLVTPPRCNSPHRRTSGRMTSHAQIQRMSFDANTRGPQNGRGSNHFLIYKRMSDTFETKER